MTRPPGQTPDPLARRLSAQMLAGSPARGPLPVAERLLAIQAQDPRGARLAIRARTAGVTAADVSTASTTFHVMQSMRLDLGYGWHVHA